MHLNSHTSGNLALIARSTLFTALLAIVCLMAVSPRAACAQSATTGAIGGTVTDSGGALLPAATVTVASVDTGATRTVKTNGSGEYRVGELEPGAYTATFTADGFATYQESAVVVTVGSLANVSPSLKTGAVTEKVEVTDQTPLMHTQDVAISTTIDQNAIDNLLHLLLARRIRNQRPRQRANLHRRVVVPR